MLMAAKQAIEVMIGLKLIFKTVGPEERPAQGVADHHETEEDSSPHNSPMWSPILRLPTGCLNMNYCLSIQATLTDELGDVPPPLHAWRALVVEDML